MSTYIRVDFQKGIIVERTVDGAISYDKAIAVVRDMIRKYAYHHGPCTMFKVEYLNE